MRTIPLTKGYVTTVDDEDYERMNGNSWCAILSTGGLVYAGRGATKTERDAGEPRIVLLHRKLFGITGDLSVEVDHRNHDGLDNRRENLRVCTKSQNQGNQRKTRGSSRYKGVAWHKRKGKWRAAIATDGRSRHLGYYVDETEAAMAYDRAALAQWGEFAHVNFGVALD